MRANNLAEAAFVRSMDIFSPIDQLAIDLQRDNIIKYLEIRED